MNSIIFNYLIILRHTALILLATRVLPASPKAKLGQSFAGKLHSTFQLFVNKAFVALYVSIISPIGPIPISLFVVELEAED